MASAQDLDFGKIGITDAGDFVPGTTVASYLDAFTYDSQYWVSLENNNSTTPSTSSNKWKRIVDGKTAATAAASANTAAALANEKAELADQKASLADDAAETANEAAEAALAAVVVAELPEIALESAVRAIVSDYTPSN